MTYKYKNLQAWIGLLNGLINKSGYQVVSHVWNSTGVLISLSAGLCGGQTEVKFENTSLEGMTFMNGPHYQ